MADAPATPGASATPAPAHTPAAPATAPSGDTKPGNSPGDVNKNASNCPMSEPPTQPRPEGPS